MKSSARPINKWTRIYTDEHRFYTVFVPDHPRWTFTGSMFFRKFSRRLTGVIALLLVLAVLVVPLPAVVAPPETLMLTIEGRSFAYDPPVVRVRQGDTVILHFEATDAVHGLALDGYPVDLRAEPGQSADVTFVATRTGDFAFRCSVSCGALHPFMIGELQVGPNLFLWRAGAATLLTLLGALLYFWPSANRRDIQ